MSAMQEQGEDAKETVRGTCGPEIPRGLQISREKSWEEMEIAEKVEALRRVLVDCAFHSAESEKWVGILRKHSHTESGKVVAPIEEAASLRDLPYWARSLSR